MKIAFINGSPRVNNSASSCILEELNGLLAQEGNIISEYYFRKPQLNIKEMKELIEYDVLVFTFPLYVDGIPSHLLNCLIQLETFFTTIDRKEITVYSLVNCGFYEGHQSKLAIEMMKIWCEKTGLKWGQGIGIGAGVMLSTLKNVPLGHGPKKNLGKALEQLANNILNHSSEENILITANFPRVMYKLAAEMGWRQSIKANGLKKKDLYRKQ